MDYCDFDNDYYYYCGNNDNQNSRFRSERLEGVTYDDRYNDDEEDHFLESYDRGRYSWQYHLPNHDYPHNRYLPNLGLRHRPNRQSVNPAESTNCYLDSFTSLDRRRPPPYPQYYRRYLPNCSHLLLSSSLLCSPSSSDSSFSSHDFRSRFEPSHTASSLQRHYYPFGNWSAFNNRTRLTPVLTNNSRATPTKLKVHFDDSRPELSQSLFCSPVSPELPALPVAADNPYHSSLPNLVPTTSADANKMRSSSSIYNPNYPSQYSDVYAGGGYAASVTGVGGYAHADSSRSLMVNQSAGVYGYQSATADLRSPYSVSNAQAAAESTSQYQYSSSPHGATQQHNHPPYYQHQQPYSSQTSEYGQPRQPHLSVPGVAGHPAQSYTTAAPIASQPTMYDSAYSNGYLPNQTAATHISSSTAMPRYGDDPYYTAQQQQPQSNSPYHQHHQHEHDHLAQHHSPYQQPPVAPMLAPQAQPAVKYNSVPSSAIATVPTSLNLKPASMASAAPPMPAASAAKNPYSQSGPYGNDSTNTYMDYYRKLYYPYDPITGEYMKDMPPPDSTMLPNVMSAASGGASGGLAAIDQSLLMQRQGSNSRYGGTGGAMSRMNGTSGMMVSANQYGGGVYGNFEPDNDSLLLCCDFLIPRPSINCLIITLFAMLVLIIIFTVVKFTIIFPSNTTNVETLALVDKIVVLLLFAALIALVWIFGIYFTSRRTRNQIASLLSCTSQPIPITTETSLAPDGYDGFVYANTSNHQHLHQHQHQHSSRDPASSYRYANNFV